jgi:Zn finger protein HypA/HybF involved in hydrogenase expression
MKIPTLTCTRCAHTWVPRKPRVDVCPKCHSPKWRDPKPKPSA